MHTFSKHAAINRVTPVLSSCHIIREPETSGIHICPRMYHLEVALLLSLPEDVPLALKRGAETVTVAAKRWAL